MITDPLPRAARALDEYRKSEAVTGLPVPLPDGLREATGDLFAALAAEERAAVRRAAARLAEGVAGFHQVQVPEVKILGVRPHRMIEGVCAYELHGDYQPSTQRIRVWMKTAIRERVCAPRTMLATVLHEVAHHLDCTRLGLPESFHTRGFFQRVDDLYHLCLGTPAEARRPLVWIKAGARWRIDWARSRARST